jgi:hypothetical protein
VNVDNQKQIGTLGMYNPTNQTTQQIENHSNVTNKQTGRNEPPNHYHPETNHNQAKDVSY